MIDIKKLLKELSLKDKISQLNLLSYNDETLEKVESGEVGSLINAYGYDLIYKLQEAALRSPHQIPLLISDDVIHGYKTTFPISLAEACSFNLPLMEQTARLSTLEARTEGINWIYAPMLDITNDPRWGRIMETSGEDPFLTSCIARSRVKGIQQEENGQITAACAKHYLGYGNVIAGLDYTATDFSEHKMRDVYLKPFKAAIDEGLLTVMHSFATYNGLPVSISKFLLQDVLRAECEFTGVLVTDWQCLKQISQYRIVRDDFEAAKEGLLAGIDVDMHGRVYFNNLELAISQSPELLEALDEAVLRILTIKDKMGLFENPFPTKPNAALTNECRVHAQKSADESIILFKNDNNLLPLSKKAKILVVGPYNNDQEVHLGMWSCKGAKENVISLRQGLENNFENLTFFETPLDTTKTDWVSLNKATEQAEIILLALGEPRIYSGENNNRMSLNLPFSQDLLVEELSKKNLPIIALVFAGRPLAITNLHNLSTAVIWSFYLGCEAGNSIARVLTGEVVPSAKTVVTFPKDLGQVPIYYNKLNTGRDEIIHYVDGDLSPLYPFGYGLSYAKFIYKDFDYTYDSNGKLILNIQIENVSNFSGKEIIQVYAIPNIVNKLIPIKELVAFDKVMILANTSIQVKIELNLDLNRYRDDITIQVGPSSDAGIFKTIALNNTF